MGSYSVAIKLPMVKMVQIMEELRKFSKKVEILLKENDDLKRTEIGSPSSEESNIEAVRDKIIYHCCSDCYGYTICFYHCTYFARATSSIDICFKCSQKGRHSHSCPSKPNLFAEEQPKVPSETTPGECCLAIPLNFEVHYVIPPHFDVTPL